MSKPSAPVSPGATLAINPVAGPTTLAGPVSGGGRVLFGGPPGLPVTVAGSFAVAQTDVAGGNVTFGPGASVNIANLAISNGSATFTTGGSPLAPTQLTGGLLRGTDILGSNIVVFGGIVDPPSKWRPRGRGQLAHLASTWALLGPRCASSRSRAPPRRAAPVRTAPSGAE